VALLMYPSVYNPSESTMWDIFLRYLEICEAFVPRACKVMNILATVVVHY